MTTKAGYVETLLLAWAPLAYRVRRSQGRMFASRGRTPETGKADSDSSGQGIIFGPSAVIADIADTANKQEALVQASLTVIHVVAAVTFLTAAVYHGRRMLMVFRGQPLGPGF